MKIENTTLLAECKRLTEKMDWDTQQWDSERMAIAVVRTVLTELGCKDELKPEAAPDRAEVVKIIKGCFTAPVNFRRQYLVESGLSPAMAEVKKASAADMA